jgi:hypothetical protein
MRSIRTALPLTLAVSLLLACAGKSVTNVTASDGGSAGQTGQEGEGGTPSHSLTAGRGGTTDNTGGTNAVTGEGGATTSPAAGGTASSGGTSGQGGGAGTASGGTASGGTAGGGTASGGTAGGGTASGGTASGGTAGGGSTTAPSCTAASSAWKGCLGSGCQVCNELVTTYPLYFRRHKNCTPRLSCTGTPSYEACSENCPEPTNDDRYGGAACAGALDGWEGCRGSGCLVCSELLNGYPRYLANHPNCGSNLSCVGEGYARCNASCPEPTDADR